MSSPPPLPAAAMKKKAKKTKRIVWVCDVCKDKKFADYDECVKHEKACTGPVLPPPMESAAAVPRIKKEPLTQLHAPPQAIQVPPQPIKKETQANAFKEPSAQLKAPPVAAAVQHQVKKANATPQCSGQAAEALEAFRKRQGELQREGIKKPDMKAFSELNRRYTVLRHGDIPGVPVGLVLNGRGEAAILGIHTSILSGIDSRKDEPCYAVCISGGYKDDDDHAPDGTIIYTGSGGQDKRKRQVKDQEENIDNGSLMLSMTRKTPVRVLRGRKVDNRPVYVYEGLYTCEDYDYVASTDGPKVYKFKLKPMDREQTRSFEVDFDPSRAERAIGGNQKAGTSRSRLQEKVAARLAGTKRRRW